MSKSDSLLLRDVRAVFRLLGECRDVGREPGLWQRRMLEGLCVIFGVVQAATGEAWWERPGRPVQPVSAYAASADAAAEHAFQVYNRAEGPRGDPIFQAIAGLSERLVTRTRRQLVSDAAWYRSVSFNRYRRMAGVDHTLVSVLQRSGDGATSVIALNRTLGDRDFTGRETRLLHLFHSELGRLIGGPLVADTEPSIANLSPRLRQTLACLLEGDSEKQVAARLGLSHATVHQYVTVLYRRFAVRSRAELLVHVHNRVRRSA
jgi:DNA-binding NarL/FixJ family response regulator